MSDEKYGVVYVTLPPDGFKGFLILQVVDEFGNLLQEKHPIENDTARLYLGSGGSSALTSSGNIVSVGTYVYHIEVEAMMVNYDPTTGNKNSETVLEREGFNKFNQVKLMSDGNLILIGENSEEDGKGDFWLVKTTSTGGVLWEKFLGTPEYDVGNTIAIASDGGYFLGGYSRGYGDYIGFYTDALLIKTDSLGNEQWRSTWGGYYNDVIWNVETTADGGVVACGSLGNGSSNESFSGYIRKMNESGELVWDINFERVDPSDGGSPYYFNMCRVLDNGNIVAVGRGRVVTADSNAGRSVPWAVMLNSKGKLLMSRAYTSLVGGFSRAEFQDIQPTADGGFLAGGTYNPGQNDTGNQDAFIVKLDERGCEYPDCMPPLAVEETKANKEDFTAYPNPFDGSITFVTSGVVGQIVIYDIRGVMVDRLTVSQDEHNVVYDGQKLTRGIYIASYTSERDARQTIRIVKQ